MECIITTKYNIGDKVLVREFGGKDVETASFCTSTLTDNGDVEYVEKPLVYTITDAKVSLTTKQVTYEIRYSHDDCIFRHGGRSVDERDIIKKVE